MLTNDESNLTKEALAVGHRQAHRQIDGVLGADLNAALRLMDTRDTYALALMEKHGWGLADLGASALDVEVSHFQALVIQGTYAANLGFPSMPVNHLKVCGLNNGLSKVCRTEAEAWAEVGKSLATRTVYQADGALAPEFIPF